MRAFMLSLSATLQLCIIVLSTVVVAFISSIIIHAFFGSLELTSKVGLITSIYMVLGTIYAVLVAFCVSGVWQNYCASELAVAHEAAALTDLVHIVSASKVENSQTICNIAINYLKEVIDVEWSVLALGQNELIMSPTSKTSIMTTNLVHEVQAIQPAVERDNIILSHALTLLTKWLDARRMRIMISKGNIAKSLWPMLIAGAFIMFSFHGLFIVGNHMLWSTLLLLFSGIIGLSFYLIFTLDCPFGGSPVVNSSPFSWALSWLTAMKL